MMMMIKLSIFISSISVLFGPCTVDGFSVGPSRLSARNVRQGSQISVLQASRTSTTVNDILLSSSRIPGANLGQSKTTSDLFGRRKRQRTRRNKATALSATATSSDSPTWSKSNLALEWRSILTLFVMNEGMKKLFIKHSIGFPAPLATCGALFVTFLFAPFGPALYKILSPGAAVLAKFLPVFFVPSLIALPLSQGFQSTAELIKVVSIVLFGFLLTLLSTSWSVLGTRSLFPVPTNDAPAKEGDSETTATTTPSSSTAAATTNAPPKKAFSDLIMKTFRTIALVSAPMALILTPLQGVSSLSSTLFRRSFMLFTTLYTFVFGARQAKPFTKIVHPLVTCTTMTWAGLTIMSKILLNTANLDLPFRTLLLEFAGPSSAGKILLGFLGPAIASLSCQMYARRRLMKENIKEVISATAVSSFGGLFGTAAVARLLQIAGDKVRLSLLSRSITSPLAMAMAGILGADVSLAVSMAVVTGILGANFGATVLDTFRIKDPVARGLGIGGASHGLGTSAFANEEDAFPFAAIAMALTASCSTVLVSIPAVKRVLINLALGL